MVDERLYKESNKIVAVRLNRFISEYSRNILKCSESVREREVAGQRLLDYLCDKFKCSGASLQLTQTPRVQRGNAQIHGLYYPIKRVIRIYNTTAKTLKPISIKSFYGTLLHEFMHHYDFTVLGFGSSPHTAGFYKRITDLQMKLGE